jgi:hypothetical protein
VWLLSNFHLSHCKYPLDHFVIILNWVRNQKRQINETKKNFRELILFQKMIHFYSPTRLSWERVVFGFQDPTIELILLKRIKFSLHDMRKQKQAERCWNDLFQSETIVEMLLTLNFFLSFSTFLFFLFIFLSFFLLMILQILEAIQKFHSCILKLNAISLKISSNRIRYKNRIVFIRRNSSVTMTPRWGSPHISLDSLFLFYFYTGNYLFFLSWHFYQNQTYSIVNCVFIFVLLNL